MGNENAANAVNIVDSSLRTGKYGRGVRFLYLLLALVLLYVLFPYYWMIISSLRQDRFILTIHPSLLPSHLTVVHYLFSWEQMNIKRFFLNSAIIGAGTTAVVLLVTTTGAYGVSRSDSRLLKSLPLMFFLVGQAVPPVVLLTPVYVIMSKLHLVNTYLAVILGDCSFGIPFAFWLQSSYFDGIPREIDEAAMADGAGFLQTLTKIMIPIAAPGIVVSGLFVFILSWDDFLFGYTLTSSIARQPITVGLFQFVGANIVQWGDLMAGACVATLPVAVVFFLIQRWLVEGLTAGAVKG